MRLFYEDAGNYLFRRKETELFVPTYNTHIPFLPKANVDMADSFSQNSHITSMRLNAREQKLKAENTKTKNRKCGVSDDITKHLNH